MGLFTRSKNMTPEERRAAADRWAVAGATLQDLGSTLGGGQGGQVQNVREYIQKRNNRSALDSLFTPGATQPITVESGFPGVFPLSIPQAPKYSAPTLSNPDTVRKLGGLMSSGVDIGKALDLIKASDEARKVQVANGVAYNPLETKSGSRIGVNLSNVNGTLADLNDPNNANRYIPKVEDGARPVYDERGNVIGQALLDGTIQTIGARAQAQAAGTAAGSAPFDLATVQSPNGGVISGSRASLLGMGPLQSQTPVEAKAAETKFDAQTAFPQVAATAQQTIDLINKLKTHPGREAATGLMGVLPPIPGTATKDFTSLLDQAKGQTFLSAYNQLKGAGAITEMEGKKAEQAIARLDRTQSKDGFLTALSDLQSVIQAGLGRAQAKASGGTSGGNYRAPPPAAVQYLRNNPAMRQAFDAKYGSGSAARVLGQ